MLEALGRKMSGEAGVERPRRVDVLDLSEEQRQHLRERIKRFSGTVRIFVHPLQGSGFGRTQEDFDRRRRIGGLLRDLVHRDPTTTPPIFIFEESARVEDLDRWLTGESSVRQEYYVVPTYPDDPSIRMPCPDGTYLPYEEVCAEGRAKDNAHWAHFRNILSNLGVSKILLAGMLFKRNERQEWGALQRDVESIMSAQRKAGGGVWYDPYNYGCAGLTAIQLSAGFDVQISDFVYPDHRKPIQDQAEVKNVSPSPKTTIGKRLRAMLYRAA